MNGFEDIDWEAASDLLKRFGALIFAALWALAARRKKKESTPDAIESEPEDEIPSSEVVPIEPGTDATKLSSQYSQRNQQPIDTRPADG